MSTHAEINSDIDKEQILCAIKNLIEEIKLLKIDNELNERFLRKNDQELLNGILARTLDTEHRKTKIQFAESVREHHSKTNNAIPQSGNSSEISLSRNASSSFADSSLRSRKSSSVSSMGTIRSGRQQMNLSLVIKADICEGECDVERADLNVFEQNMKTQFTELMAEVEEIKLTTQDVLYAREMFKDFVILKGTNPVTMQVPLERFQKFIRNYNKNGTIAIEKMRLKCFTLESNYADKKQELQQRMDMSSILRPVDFEQLKIDIKNLTSSLDEKTANMMGLKSINGNISTQLVDERRQLLAFEDHLHGYKEKCKAYRRDTEQMCDKIIKIEKDITYWKNLVDELNEKVLSFSAPSFEDYFQLKIRLRNTHKEEYRLQRKKNIGLIKLKNLRHKLAVMKIVNARQN